MSKSRLEAFSDGVIAILITIMVLELKAPATATWEALRPAGEVLLSYLLSFVFLGIYWNNHHHLFQAVKHISGNVLWANLHLLFWLSLVSFATRWMGESQFASLSVAVYGVVLLFSGVAYTILVRALLKNHDADSALARAIGSDFKGKVSIALYAFAIPLAFILPVLAGALYVSVAIIWFVPDKRFERELKP